MSKESDRITVVMSDGTQYEGDISLHDRARLVDLMNHPDPFFNLRKAVNKEGEKFPLLVLSKHHVVSLRHLAPPENELNGTVMLRKSDAPKAVFKVDE